MQKKIILISLLSVSNLNCSEAKIKDDLSYTSATNSTAGNASLLLHEAAAFSDGSAVNSLLDQGAGLDNVNERNEVPLFFAVREKNAETFSILVAKGANLEALNNMKETVLHYAARSGFTEIFTHLDFDLQSLNIKNSEGKTAFHLACDHAQEQWKTLFLARHLFLLLEVNACDEDSLYRNRLVQHHGCLEFATCCTKEVLNGYICGKEQDSFLTYAVSRGIYPWYIKKMLIAGAELEYESFEVIDANSGKIATLEDDEEIIPETGSIIHSSSHTQVPGKKALKATALRKAINRQNQLLTELLIHEGASLERIAPEEPAANLTQKQALFIRSVRMKDWEAICRAVNTLYPSKKFNFLDEDECPLEHDDKNFGGDSWFLERIRSACEEGCFLCLESYLGNSNHIDVRKQETLDEKTREWTDEKGFSYMHHAIRVDSPYCIDRLTNFGFSIPVLPFSHLGTINFLRYAIHCNSFHAADKLIQKGILARVNYVNCLDSAHDDVNYLRGMLRYAYLVQDKNIPTQSSAEQNDDSLYQTLKTKTQSGDQDAQKQAIQIFLRMLSLKKFDSSQSMPFSTNEPLIAQKNIKDLAVEYCAQKIFPRMSRKIDLATVTKLIEQGFDEILKTN